MKLDLLEEDIMNVPYHVFGDHTKCSKLGGWTCQKENNMDDTSTTNGTSATTNDTGTTNGTSACKDDTSTTNGTSATKDGTSTTNGTSATKDDTGTTNGTNATKDDTGTANSTSATEDANGASNGTSTTNDNPNDSNDSAYLEYDSGSSDDDMSFVHDDDEDDDDDDDDDDKSISNNDKENNKGARGSGVSKTGKDKSTIELLKDTKILDEILHLHRLLLKDVESLLLNTTTNLVENMNSLFCKFTIGKRLCISLTGSYKARCYCAIISASTKKLLTLLIQQFGKKVPSYVTILEDRKEKKVRENKNYVSKKRREKKFADSAKDYGQFAEAPDMEDDVYEKQKKIVEDLMKNELSERLDIVKRTVGQALNDEWMTRRAQKITASKYGVVCKRRETTLCANLVKELLYPPDRFSTYAIRYGMKHEATAKTRIESLLGVDIIPTGFWLDEKIPYLGATPDGLINEDLKDLKIFGSRAKERHTFKYEVVKGGVVEVKCPERGQDCTVNKLIKTYPYIRAIFNKKNPILHLNKNHNFYYQVQGQLHHTKRTYGIFGLWTPSDIRLILVWRDDKFWSQKMEPKLTRFFEKCMLPEIVDGRFLRSMPIREPEYILEKIKEKNEIKTVKKIPPKKCKRKIDPVPPNASVQTGVKKARQYVLKAVAQEDIEPVIQSVLQEDEWIDD